MNQNLKKRIITALIGLPLVLGLIISGGMAGITFLSWVISMGMLYEFCNMIFNLPDRKTKIAIALLFNTFIYALNYGLGSGLSHAFLGLVPMMFFFAFFLFRVPALRVLMAGRDEQSFIGVLQKHMYEMMAICFGFVYCSWLPLLMIKIREHQNGVHWILLTFVTVWANDTGAYFAGRKYGKYKLFKTVSPKKTWEGALAGTVLSIAVGVIYTHFFLPTTDLLEISIILAVVSIAAQIGDLCESLLKRAVDVKDSSGILPGHGGFLDRFDGMVFALPIMNAYLWIFSGF